MKKAIKKFYSISLLFILSLIIITGCTNTPREDIIILYTSDVHCGIEDNIGYAGVSAYKNEMLKETPYVSLVDCGDALQGEVIGTISKGEYIIDIMNYIGYDYATIGNHEFDFGMDKLKENINKFDGEYLGCNITYSGKYENKLEEIKPYEIKRYGNIDVAFIGVSTPYSIESSTPSFFKEDDEFVYGFTNGNNGLDFYNKVQTYIDECLKKGAEFIVVMSHLGDADEYAPFSSKNLINNTRGIDVVLDGHEHSTISSLNVKNLDGEEVILSTTGTKLSNIGKLIIKSDNTISTELISEYDKKDTNTQKYIDGIKAIYEDEVNKVVANSLVNLSGYTTEGIRLVRNRETTIGNLCADAYRFVTGADIGIVNGGGVRADIYQGDITYADIIKVNPYGNLLCVVEATGQEILDSLEIGAYRTKKEIEKDGNATGEFGGFHNVSGLKYTIDTSIESTVLFDENNMFVEVSGQRRVKDVFVLNKEGIYEPLDPNKVYTVASHNYLIKSGGDGITVYMDNNLLMDEGMSDYQVIITYIFDYLNGIIDERYEETEGRISIE